jgi:hypothetical protein
MALTISNKPDPVDALHFGKGAQRHRVLVRRRSPIIQWTNHGGPNQQFSFERVTDCSFRVRARQSQKVLDVFGASLDNGAAIIQWDWLRGANQMWRHRPVTVFD